MSWHAGGLMRGGFPNMRRRRSVAEARAGALPIARQGEQCTGGIMRASDPLKTT